MEESGQIRLLFPLEGTSVPVGLEAGGTFEEGKYIVARLVLLHCHSFCLFLFGAIAPPPQWAMASSFTRFLDHTTTQYSR